MTVGELMDYLDGQPRDRLVVLAKDEEGNGFSPLYAAEMERYVAETTYSGDLTEDPDGGEPVVLLWPVN
jgi:hypothetical protein